MQDFLLSHYQLLKAFHLIAVIAWMCGLLYLPRLFVYHSDTKVGSEVSETFKIMEHRLLRYITTPAMIVSLILGLLLLHAYPDLMSQGWFHIKLTCLLIMFACHGYIAKLRKQFFKDERPHSSKFFRVLNEIPTVMMIIIVVVVLVQPSF